MVLQCVHTYVSDVEEHGTENIGEHLSTCDEDYEHSDQSTSKRSGSDF